MSLIGVPKITNMRIVPSETGIKVTVVVVLDSGLTFPLTTPEISYGDLWRDGEQGFEAVRAEGRRFWTRVTRWLGLTRGGTT